MIQNKLGMAAPLSSHLHEDSLHVSDKRQLRRSRHSHLQSRLFHFLLSFSLQWLPSSMHSQLQVSSLSLCFPLSHSCLQLQLQAVWLLREISACSELLLISLTLIVTSSCSLAVHWRAKKRKQVHVILWKIKEQSAMCVSYIYICALVYSNFIGNHRVLCLSFAWTKNGLETQLIHGLISATCRKPWF